MVSAITPLGPIASLLDHIAELFGLANFHTIGYAVNGTIFPAVTGTRVTVQSSRGAGWATVASGPVEAGGHYSISVAHPGNYRVLSDGTVGPEITVG